LIVDDVEHDALVVVRELRRGGFDVAFERVDTPEAMTTALAEKRWDILAEDVKTQTGVLLVARGYEVTDRLLELVRNFPGEAMRSRTWRVIVPVRGPGSPGDGAG